MPKKYYYTYVECKEIIQANNIKSISELRAFRKATGDEKVPSVPSRTYLDEWDSNDFFNKLPFTFFSYDESKEIIKKYNVHNVAKYIELRKNLKEARLPASPWLTYENEWDARSFFGKSEYYSYEGCKKVVQENNLTSRKGYIDFRKSSGDTGLPSAPWLFYKNEWEPNHFFHKVELYCYEDCLKIVHENNITSRLQYQNLYHELGDARLPYAPWVFYKNEWSTKNFLRKVAFYSYKECKKIVQENNLSSQNEYRVFRKKSGDEKLPSSPYLAYRDEWDGKDFFNKKGLYSYDECKRIVQKNNVTNHSEYKAFRKNSNDIRLPNMPYVKYKEEWDGKDFFAIPFTLEEFRERLSKSNIVKKIDYEEKLQITHGGFPKNPIKYYGFHSFQELTEFEFYGLEKICEYIQKHKIVNSEVYMTHAKTNPYLRAHPNKIKGFVGSLHYYKKTPFCDLIDQYPEYKPYANVAEKLSSKGSNIAKRVTIYRLFIEFIAKQKAPSKPHEFLHKKTVIISLERFFNESAKIYAESNSVAIIVGFIDALLLEYCADIDEDTGEVVYLPDFHNPYLKHELATDYAKRKPQETTKKILPFAYINSGRKTLCPPFATAFKDLTKAIEIYDCDFFEVEESQIDKNDPNCVWRTKDIYRKSGREKQRIHEIWSPVRTIAMFVLLELPVRGQQILWNDSGEADREIPIINSQNEIEWVMNTHKLAGEFERSQGFIKRYDDALGFHCTTNKTKGREGGYSVPYMPDELPRWLIRLRDWQIKYNPIEKTTKWSNHFLPSAVDKNRLKHRGFNGRQCFLFRAPQAKSSILRAQPLTTSLFKVALPILLFNVQETNVPLAKWEGTGKPTNTPSNYTSQFTPHSLRASLITAYIVDHNLNPSLVAKLVGHANVVMTIYYAKVTEPAMRRELKEAEKRALKGQSEQVQDMLISDKFENLVSVFIDNSNGAFLKSFANEFDIGAVVYFDYGFCPVGGQSCGEGGDLVAEKSAYRLPVQTSSVLGRRNCVQCRFFVTGFAYMPGLKALGDILALKTAEAEVEMSNYQQLVDDLIDERDDCESSGKHFIKRAELNKLQSAYETTSSEFIALTGDLVRVYRLADACGKSLINRQSGTSTENVPLVINSDDVIFIEAREVSMFEQLDTVCKNAELYTVGNPKHAIMERTRALDILLHHNEISERIFTLSQKDQLKIGNHLTTMLVEKLGGWSKLDAVIDGHNKLNDFLELKDIKNITRTIKQLDNPIHIQNLGGLA